jgi:hypothetical protein
VRRLLLLLLLAFPSPCAAVQLRTPDGQVAQPFQRWANRSLVPSAPGVVTVHIGLCPDGTSWACYDGAARTVYIDLADESRWMVHGQFLHELGHDYDGWLHARGAGFRRRFSGIFGLGTPWEAAPGADGHATDHYAPEELFADAYSACAERRVINAFSWERVFALGGEYQPTPKQHLRVCALMRVVRSRPGR